MTVLARVVRATPYRSADEAWAVIIDMLAADGGAARDELMKVAGVATTLIAAEVLKDDKVYVWGGGPQVRITCLYDEHAISGNDAREEKLPRSPTEGRWRMSLPCPEDDLTWVQAALAKKSTQVTARKVGEKPDTGADETASSSEASINKESFFSAMSAFVVVNTYSHSVTYVADKMLHSLHQIVRDRRPQPREAGRRLGRPPARDRRLARQRAPRVRHPGGLRPRHGRPGRRWDFEIHYGTAGDGRCG